MPQEIDEVRTLRDGLVRLDDESLTRAARSATRLPEFVAVAVGVAARVLGVQMFDAQLEGALALAHGRIVEMQTGEGKTLAASSGVGVERLRKPSRASAGRTPGGMRCGALTRNDRAVAFAGVSACQNPSSRATTCHE